MKQSEKTMLEFAGYCFIHKPELANELNTLIADFINKPKEQLPINGVVKSLPTEECVRDWYKEGDIDDNFWKHSTEWSNEDVFKEVYKALKYFINRWQ